MTTAAPPQAPTTPNQTTPDINIRAIDKVEESLGERCEMNHTLLCPFCHRPHIGPYRCELAAEWLAVIRNCANHKECRERETCTHAICTECKDQIANGNALSARGLTSIAYCEPIRKK